MQRSFMEYGKSWLNKISLILMAKVQIGRRFEKSRKVITDHDISG